MLGTFDRAAYAPFHRPGGPFRSTPIRCADAFLAAAQTIEAATSRPGIEARRRRGAVGIVNVEPKIVTAVLSADPLDRRAVRPFSRRCLPTHAIREGGPREQRSVMRKLDRAAAVRPGAGAAVRGSRPRRDGRRPGCRQAARRGRRRRGDDVRVFAERCRTAKRKPQTISRKPSGRICGWCRKPSRTWPVGSPGTRGSGLGAVFSRSIRSTISKHLTCGNPELRKLLSGLSLSGIELADGSMKTLFSRYLHRHRWSDSSCHAAGAVRRPPRRHRRRPRRPSPAPPSTVTVSIVSGREHRLPAESGEGEQRRHRRVQTTTRPCINIMLDVARRIWATSTGRDQRA